MPPTDPSAAESYSTFWNSAPDLALRSSPASTKRQAADAYADFHAAIEDQIVKSTEDET